MQIKFATNLLIDGDKVKVVLIPEGAKLKEKGDIVISSELSAVENAFLINEPGEYEVKDVFVYAISINGGKNPRLFSINVDGITIVYLSAEVTEIPKHVIDEIGVDDISIIDFKESDENLSEKIKLLDDLDPAIFIPIRAGRELLEKIAKETELELPEVQSKLKYAAGDFDEEERSLKLALL